MSAFLFVAGIVGCLVIGVGGALAVLAILWWMLEQIVRYFGWYAMIFEVAARIHKEWRAKRAA